jgi:hypothetical protein
MKKLLSIIVILISPTLLAAEYGPWTTVEKIYQQTLNETPYINFGENSMPGCHGNNGGYLGKLNEKGSERTFSLILTALTAGREVRVYYRFNDVASDYTGWGLCDIDAIHIR